MRASVIRWVVHEIVVGCLGLQDIIAPMADKVT